jgi:hypothetical protein
MSAASSHDEKALEAVRRDLAVLAGRAQRSSMLTLVVGAIALAALTGYFWFGYNKLKEFSQPQLLVDYGAQIMSDRLPEARASLEKQVRDQAPAWAEGLSRRAIESMPTAREQLEKYLSKQLDEALDKGTIVTEEKFREFLKDNHETLAVSIRDISTSPEEAEKELEAIEAGLEKTIQGDLRRTFRDMCDGLVLVNEKLDRLKKAEGLTEGELLERRVAILARRVMKSQSPMPAARIVPVNSAAGDAEPKFEPLTVPPGASLDAPAEAPAGSPPIKPEAGTDKPAATPEPAEAPKTDPPAEQPKAEPAPEK